MNRYGRHGSGAWLRRHMRRRQTQVSSALAIAKPFIPLVVFNITVPAGVERVIIVVSDQSGNTIGTSQSIENTTSPDFNKEVDSTLYSEQNVERNTDQMQKISPYAESVIARAESEAERYL